MLITENIIIIHRYAFSESSLILKALSPTNGLISIIAKDARRPKNTLSSYIEPLNLCECVYIHKDSRQIQTLKEASLISSFPNMRSNLEYHGMGMVISEIILKTSLGECDANHIF